MTLDPAWMSGDSVSLRKMPPDVRARFTARIKAYEQQCERREIAPKHKYLYIDGRDAAETEQLRRLFVTCQPKLNPKALNPGSARLHMSDLGLPYPKKRGATPRTAETAELKRTAVDQRVSDEEIVSGITAQHLPDILGAAGGTPETDDEMTPTTIVTPANGLTAVGDGTECANGSGNGHHTPRATAEMDMSLRSLSSPPGWPPPPPGAFHGLAGDIVRMIEPYSEADPVAILVHERAHAG
jgi:hypothetical protein